VKNKTLALLLLLSLILSACNLGAPAPQDANALATAAAQTVEAVLTPAASPVAAQATPEASPIPGVAIDGTTAEPIDSAACDESNIIVSWERDGATYDKKAVDTPLAPGSNFVMSWVLENNGTCVWDGNIVFKFTDGTRLTLQDEIPVMPSNYRIRTGEQLTVNVQMTAPTAPGSYETSFSLVKADGESIVNFGVLTTVGNTNNASLAAPGDLRYSYDCSSGSVNITLNWVDKADNEAGYRIFRDGAKLTDLPAGSTTYNDIAPGSGSYQYTVAAFNAGGESASKVQAETSNCQ